MLEIFLIGETQQLVDIFISNNQALQILYLKHHNNEYETS